MINSVARWRCVLAFEYEQNFPCYPKGKALQIEGKACAKVEENGRQAGVRVPKALYAMLMSDVTQSGAANTRRIRGQCRG